MGYCVQGVKVFVILSAFAWDSHRLLHHPAKESRSWAWQLDRPAIDKTRRGKGKQMTTTAWQISYWQGEERQWETEGWSKEWLIGMGKLHLGRWTQSEFKLTFLDSPVLSSNYFLSSEVNIQAPTDVFLFLVNGARNYYWTQSTIYENSVQTFPNVCWLSEVSVRTGLTVNTWEIIHLQQQKLLLPPSSA